MIHDWYKTWFGNEYLTVYNHRDEQEAQFLLNLILKNIPLKKNHKILDLCCGQGRHSLILSKLGFSVFGMDLSRTLLEIAKFKNTKNSAAYFIQADMRNIPVRDSIDLLLNLFTSFGYFQSDEENNEVFFQFNRSLRSGGYFVFDYFNSKHVVENLVPFQTEKIEGLLINLERKIENGRVLKKIFLSKNNSNSVFYESVKMYHPDEIFRMMDKAELYVYKVFGDYDGSDFSEKSPRLLVIGRKK